MLSEVKVKKSDMRQTKQWETGKLTQGIQKKSKKKR